MPEFISILRWIRDIVYPQLLETNKNVKIVADNMEEVKALNTSIEDGLAPFSQLTISVSTIDELLLLQSNDKDTASLKEDGLLYVYENSTWKCKDWKTVYSILELEGLNTLIYSKAKLVSDGRSGDFIYDATQSAVNNGGTIFNGWIRQFSGKVNGKWFGMKGDFNYTTRTGTDNKQAILNAIASLGGTTNINTAYQYDPASTLYIPEGDYGVSLLAGERFLIDRNNIKIIGAGMFNTNIIHMGTSNVKEMFRFKEAYACELSSLSLDGGLPFTPTGTETNGIDTLLVLDQVAHFESRHLNLCNYRYRGKQCIHVWESWFDDLRIFNGGFFGNAYVASAGIAFDEYNKESTFFSGGESNQIKYGKVAFGTVGTLVKMTSPCFNVSFDFVVAEGRTWGVNYTSLGEPKWIIDGSSSGIVVHHAWSYHHDQPFNRDATLFSLVNAGFGCKFLNYTVYQELPSGSGNFLEVPNIIHNTSAYPIELNISIDDKGDAKSSLFGFATGGSMVVGNINYMNDSTRDVKDFIGTYGVKYFSGKLTYIAGNVTAYTPDVYNLDGKANNYSQIGGHGFYEEFKVRATAVYNGSIDNLLLGQNLTVLKNSTGSYSFTFVNPMPDNLYTISHALIKSNLGDQIELGSQLNTGFSLAVRDHLGNFHDTTRLNVTISR